MKSITGQLMLATFLTLIATHADATIIYLANLNGFAETPSNVSSGTGLAKVEYDSILHTLFIDVNFSDLAGLTTAAHIHCCIASPANVSVATAVPNFLGFPVGITSGNYNNVFDLTQASSFNSSFITGNGGTVAGAEAALAAGLANEQAYFDIHTQAFAGGEIRGFLVPQVPEPETYAMMITGLGLMCFIACRRKNEQA
jgi:hypothetical protein